MMSRKMVLRGRYLKIGDRCSFLVLRLWPQLVHWPSERYDYECYNAVCSQQSHHLNNKHVAIEGVGLLCLRKCVDN